MKTMNRTFTRAAWLAAAVAAMSLLSACQREEAPQNDEQTPSGPVSVQVTIDQDTRTSVSETTGAITFSVCDAIKIFNGNGVYTGITQSAESSAMFAMEEGFSATVSGSGRCYAGFPADLVTDITSEGVTFTLPTTYRYSQVGGSSANTAKVPCPMVGDFTGSGGISLKPVCALVRFFLTNVAAGNLTFTFVGNDVAGTATVTTPSESADSGIQSYDLSNARASITVTGVPEVEKGDYICITLPVTVGTSPRYIVVANIPSDGRVRRSTLASGRIEPLSRGHGYRVVNLSLSVPEPKEFSVSGDKTVVFSPGNLQYIGSAETPYWKFADYQLDRLGNTTGQNSTATNVDRDLFGWATSGYNGKNPWMTSITDTNYGPAITSGEWTSDSDEWDWGVHNTISNGGSYSWRTLTADEWPYLLGDRSCSPRYAQAKVAGVNGLILFPDGYTHPSGVAAINNADSDVDDYSDNTFDSAAWTLLEQTGCVFLPTTGLRDGTDVRGVNLVGCYWSSTAFDNSNARGLYFLGGYVHYHYNDDQYRRIGYSVRLVRDIN